MACEAAAIRVLTELKVWLWPASFREHLLRLTYNLIAGVYLLGTGRHDLVVLNIPPYYKRLSGQG